MQQEHETSERFVRPAESPGGAARSPGGAATREAEHLARALRRDALARGEAVVVGNRAGVVEWAAESWRTLTGFPLEQTIDKPISHFLEQAGLEVELVDFVARHFLEGCPCTVALTFDTLDGRSLDLQLDVEPIRSEGGEIDRFVAVVREQAAPTRGPAPAPSSGSSASRAEPTAGSDIAAMSPALSERRDRRRHLLHIEPIVAGALARRRPGASNRGELVIDAGLDAERVPVHSRAPGAPGSAIAASRLAGLLDRLIAASLATETVGPRHLTLLTGRLEPGRSHHSLAHAIPQRAVASLDGARAFGGAHTFLEVHDTSPHLDRAALARIRAGAPGDDPREAAWTEAAKLARQLGARLLFDSTPGCGNQALLVFEAA